MAAVPTTNAFRGSRLGQIPPIGAAVSAVQALSGVGGIITNLESAFGDLHKYGQPQFTGAEKSRADTYLLGIAGGSVLAGQYLLGQHKTDTSDFAQQYTAEALTQAEAAYPNVMQQAAQEGPIPDAADGSGGLGILLSLKIPYSAQYAGYSTNTGAAPTGTTLTLVQKVAALPPPTAINAGLATTAALSSTLNAGFSSPIVLLGLVGAGAYAWTHRAPRRRS